MKSLISFFILISVTISCCFTRIHKHFMVVQVSYELADLESWVKRERSTLQSLKVERAKLMVPHYLDNAAGRGGYMMPRSEQIVILRQEEE